MIMESLSNAKAAVGLDVRDSHSWYVLGNAYLVYALGSVATGERDALVEKSLKTYKHAMKVNAGAIVSADLQFNYGVGCKYLEKHLDALEAFAYCERVRQTHPHTKISCRHQLTTPPSFFLVLGGARSQGWGASQRDHSLAVPANDFD